MTAESPLPPPTSQARRWLVLFVKLLVAALAALGAQHAFRRALAELAAQDVSWRDLQPHWLALAGAAYLGGLFPCAIFWRTVLFRLGERPPVYDTLRAYYVGHLGKYVPGKALVVVLRAALIRSAGVTTAAAVVSVFYETLWMMAVGASVAVLAIAARVGETGLGSLSVLAVGLAIVAGVPLAPPIFHRIVRFVGRNRISAEMLDKIGDLNYRTLAGGWLLVAGGWLLTGVSLWCATRAAGSTVDLDLNTFAICTSAAALGVVAGFVSFIPGGLLVREAVLLPLLAPAFGAGRALAAVVAHRLATIVAELAISSILYVYVVHRDSRAERRPES